MVARFVLAFWLAASPALAGSHGSNISSAQAPSGFNLGALTIQNEQPFLNLIHTGQYWGASAATIAVTNVSQGAADPNNAGHNLVRVTLSSNASIVTGTLTASISNDLYTGNYGTAQTASISGSVLTISGAASGIAGTWGQNCNGGQACLVQALVTSSGSIAAGTTITVDSSNTTGTSCGGSACTGSGGSGTYGLNNSSTYSGSIQGSSTTFPVLHVTSVTGTVDNGDYVSAPAATGTTISTVYSLLGAGASYKLTGTQSNASSQTILTSTLGGRLSISGVVGPTEANSCTTPIPVNDGQSFDCWGVDYSGTAYVSGGQVGIRYAEYDYAFNLDANGYPQSMSGTGPASGVTLQEYDFSILQCSGITPSQDCNNQVAPFYPSGQYLLQYTGGAAGCGGSIALSNDASCAQTVSQGIDVYNVTPSANGILVKINNITGGYVHGVSLVYCGTYLAVAVSGSHCTTGYDLMLANGEMLNPGFVAKMSQSGQIRFMDWLITNANTQQHWSQRPTTSQIFWDSALGTVNQPDPMPSSKPIEAMVALLNETHSDGWFNMPPLVDDNYITQFATLVHNTLSPKLRVYVEDWNEVWASNTNSITYFAAMPAAKAAFPNYASPFQANVLYYEALRAQQARSLWKTAWGSDAARVFGVIAGQGSGDGPCSSGVNNPVNCVVLNLPPGYGGSNIATQWTAYGLRTDTATSTASTIAATGVMTVGGTITGAWQVGQYVTAANIAGPNMISVSAANTTATSCNGSPCTGTASGGGTFLITGTAPTISAAQTINASAVSASNIDVFAAGVYLNCGMTSGASITAKIDNGSGSAGNTLTVSAVGSGAVIKYQTLTGAGVTAANITGGPSAGSTGTYTIDGAAQLVSSESMTATSTEETFWSEMYNAGPDCSGTWYNNALTGANADVTQGTAFMLPVVSYEWGQQFRQGGAVGQIFTNALRDGRMYYVWYNLATAMKAGGRDFSNYFVAMATPSSFGEFVALENVNQQSTPTYQAIVDWNQANPCWWGSQAPWSNAGGCTRH